MALTPQESAELAALETKFSGQQGAKAAPAMSPQEKPEAGFLRGGARKVMETYGEAPLRFLANRGVEFAKNAVDKFEQHKQDVPLSEAGKWGATTADVGMMMAAPEAKALGAARFLVPAIQGAVQHQAQNYANTGTVDPTDAALETGISAATMGVGSKLPALFKGAGKRILRDAIQPVGKQAGLNVEPALQDGLGRYIEGLTGLQKRVTGKVSSAGKAKVAELENAGFQGRRGKAMIDAVKDIDSRTPEMGPKLGLNAPERQDAITGVNRWAEPTSNLTPKETVSLLSKVYDDAYKSGRDINLAGRERGAREFGKQLRGQMDTHMATQPLDALGRYETASKDFREFEPIRQAVNHRVDVPSSKRLALGRIPAVGGLIEAGVYRPGTANLVYDIGRISGSKGGRFAGKRMIDLGRSLAASPEEN